MTPNEGKDEFSKSGSSDEVTVARSDPAVVHLRSELETILTELTQELAADVVTLFLYDVETNEFDLPIERGLRDPETFKDPRMRPRTDRVVGKIVRERRPIIAERVTGHKFMDGPFARREGISSAAGFPLVHNDQSVGVLFVNFRDSHIFSLADQQVIQAASRQASAAIAQSDVFSILRKDRIRLPVQEEQTLNAIVSLACNVMNCPVAIWTLEPRSQSLHIQASTGLPVGYVDTAEVHLDDDDVISEVIRTGQHQILDNLANEGLFRYPNHARVAGWHRMLAYPVALRGRTSAVIQVFSFQPGVYSQEDFDTLQRLSDIASVALENAQRSREAEKLAQIARALSSTPDFERAMEVIVGSARELTGADSSVMILLEKRTDSFIVGCRKPPEGPPTFTPRAEGGLTRGIITSGKPIKIDDTLEDERVSRTVVEEGVRSLIGVRVQIENERIGALYIDGLREAQFTDYDVSLLQTLADQASVTLGWARWLRKPSDEIERTTLDLFRLEEILKALGQEIQSKLGFEFAAIQMIRPEDRIIETVYGTGVGRLWAGRAKHYLEPNPALRDIQTDIALDKRTEIIAGWDNRFDRWIFDEYNHAELIRIFTPIVLVRDEQDRLIDDWFQDCQWNVLVEKENQESQHTIIEMNLAQLQTGRGNKFSIEAIGTVEAGYSKHRHLRIAVEEAIALARLVARRALDIHRTLLRRVLEIVVENAMHVVSADSASLHFLYDQNREKYVYEVCAGEINRRFLRTHQPRPNGLGREAIQDGQPKFIPDPSQGHADMALKTLNPGIFEEGICAIAAFPLLVGQWEGVLYVHFKRRHRFTEDEIGWIQLFTNQAVDGIRHAATYTQMRDHARQLTTLHSVAQSLVSTPEGDLLRHIAWNTLNLLAADVVTIYEYVEPERRFVIPPEIAGRLIAADKMRTDIERLDVPNEIIACGCNVYAEQSAEHEILDNSDRVRPADKRESFVKREKIASSAAILLKVREETVGVMFINFRRPHQFSEEERKIIETLAWTAAIAIKNRRFLETLVAIDREIISTLDLRNLLGLIVQRAVQITGADRGVIRRLDPVNRELVVQARYPKNEGYDPALNRISLDSGITGWVATHRQSALVPDVQIDSRYLAYFDDTRTELAVPLLDSDSRVLGVINVESRRVSAFDWTDQQRLEALANQTVLAIQNVENKERRVAAETMATIGDLAGSLVHKMFNDVGAIKELAKDIDSTKGMDRSIRKAAKDIQSLAETLIQEARELQRWIVEKPHAVDLVQTVIDALDRVYIPALIDQSVTLPRELPQVPGGEQQLMDSFINLIQNAVKAMPKGGSLSVGGRKIEWHNRSWVTVWVRDTGVGISEEDLERIFQRRFTTRSHRKGLGFGLWWTQTYIERLGGRLIVRSKLGEGTTFTVMLPEYELDSIEQTAY